MNFIIEYFDSFGLPMGEGDCVSEVGYAQKFNSVNEAKEVIINLYMKKMVFMASVSLAMK